jgi:hypothetical protein
MYLWCPYQWFHLVHLSQVDLFFRTVERTYYSSIGSHLFTVKISPDVTAQTARFQGKVRRFFEF